MTKNHFVCCALTTFFLAACDAETTAAEAAEFEHYEEEELVENFDVETAEELPEDMGAWDGLTSEDIDALELENGVDLVQGDGAVETFDDLTAPPEAVGAPGCAHLTQWKSGAFTYAKVTNNCGYTIRVRPIWRFAHDGRCYSISPGWSRSWRDYRYAYVTHLQSC